MALATGFALGPLVSRSVPAGDKFVWEFGGPLGAARPPDIEAVMVGFMRTATPDVFGAVVGRIVKHLARGPLGPAGRANPETGRAEPGA